MVQYKIADIINIKNEGFEYQLGLDVINRLRDLHRNFKPNVDVIKQINFKKTKLSFNKPTHILSEENKVSVTTSIKLLLNKVSQKNYLDCIEKFTEMILSITDSNELFQIAELLFEVASTNRFYTNIYSDIYSHFMTLNNLGTESVFYTYYKTVYGTYLGMFENMVYFDPNKDYDQFCVMNTLNEKRKALSTFLSGLMKNGMIPRNDIESALQTLINKTENFISEVDRVNEVDELVENINCLYSPTHHFDLFHNKLKHLSTIKYKEYPSMSSKTVFKLQDIVKRTK
jgi:hypothetical protein